MNSAYPRTFMTVHNFSVAVAAEGRRFELPVLTRPCNHFSDGQTLVLTVSSIEPQSSRASRAAYMLIVAPLNRAIEGAGIEVKWVSQGFFSGMLRIDAMRLDVKHYLLIRWKKRWPIVPAGIGCAILWRMRSLAMHDGRERGAVLLPICFAVIVILFPFHWGDETWDDN
jgi:hypothetical protein